MSEITVSTIIVSYNTAGLMLQTIQSLKDDLIQNPKLKNSSEIIVVDNNSQDESVAKIKAFQKTSTIPVVLLQSKENLGFGRANNLGITKANGKFLFFLNSDTIVQPKAVSTLISAFEAHPLYQPSADLSSYSHKLDRVGIISAQLLNTDGTLQPQGGSLPSLVSLFAHYFMLDDIPIIGQTLPSTQHTGRKAKYQKTAESHLVQKPWVAATAMMVRQEMLAETGVFDPNIFMYGEDMELCLRAHNHHWDVALHPNAHVTHLGSASSSSERAIIGEMLGYLHIWAKHKPLWQFTLVKSILITGSRLRIFLFGTILRDQARAKTYINAIKELAQQ